MEPEDTPPMSGSNSFCVSTVLLDSGIVPMREPLTEMVLEAPGGLVHVSANCRNGKAERITVRNLPSFVAREQADIEVAGMGTIRVATAYGGDSFAIVDAADMGFAIDRSEARDIARTGMKITKAANRQLGFKHPGNPEWDRISFCLFAGRCEPTPDGIKARQAVAIKPGKVDRSPTGTAVSARMALLHAQGLLSAGRRYRAISIIGSEFSGRIAGTVDVAGIPAIIPEISGRRMDHGHSPAHA